MHILKNPIYPIKNSCKLLCYTNLCYYCCIKILRISLYYKRFSKLTYFIVSIQRKTYLIVP